jgi:hypothetical protein
MSKLGEKERKELRRRAFELHLQDDQLIAVGHVAIRSAMLDKLIDLTFQQIIRHYPARVHLFSWWHVDVADYGACTASWNGKTVKSAGAISGQ